MCKGENKHMKKHNCVKNIILILAIFVLMFAVVFACQDFRKKQIYMTSEEIESGENTDVYVQLSEKDYKINNDTNEITFSDDVTVGSFVISENSEQPTENDKWILAKGQKTIKLEDEIEENSTKQVYVYYNAGTVSTMTTDFNTSADTYIIRNLAELKDFSTKVNAGNTFAGKTIYLVNNIASNNKELLIILLKVHLMEMDIQYRR